MAAMRILGIDPGLRITGYGLVDAQPARLDARLVEAGIIRLDGKLPIDQRLVQLRNDLAAILLEHRPDQIAVEQIYSHYAHPRTAVLMAHARGVILLTGRQHGLPITDLPSTEVKKAVTGYGHASKQQMQRAVQAQCGLAEPPEPADVADAIAIALTHARRLALEAV
jgi:crossover junction endodeoxyribonuclease RuvC